jgi:hypothetical protein
LYLSRELVGRADKRGALAQLLAPPLGDQEFKCQVPDGDGAIRVSVTGAGMFAPVVAFVPTLDPGTCWLVESAIEDRAANIPNNLSALLIASALALIFALWRAWCEPTSATLPEIAQHFDISEANARSKADGLLAQGKLIVEDGCRGRHGWPRYGINLDAETEVPRLLGRGLQERSCWRSAARRLPGLSVRAAIVTSRANPQVVICDLGRADGRATALFGSVEPIFNSLENRCASYWRTGSSNLPPPFFAGTRSLFELGAGLPGFVG